MIPDPSRIAVLAARLREEGLRVSAISARVAALEGVDWRSAAANAFRDRVEEAAGHLRCTAQLLDDAADTTEAHARAVAAALDELAAFARRALSTLPGGS